MRQAVSTRYCDRPADWRTRLFGAAGTGAVALALVLAAFVTWVAVRPTPAPSRPLVVALLPLASPPEPVLDMPPGPRQIEQQPAARRKETAPEPAITPQAATLAAPALSAEPPSPAPQPPVPQTSAPVAVPATPAARLATPDAPDWEAVVLAHLGRFRQYPARARAARQTGVAHVHFRMSRAGMVSEARIVRSSGSVTLDQAALDTLRRAQPLPPIPAERPDTLELTVPVEFRIDPH